MAFTSLYRRYRPEKFGDVIGQDHIVRTLVNQIGSGSVGHAYLFTGTRGTGKTSVAKIFARAVNCERPDGGSPCGLCATCKELSSPANFDVLEIDAASNNSVDQIRELTDKVGFPPTVGRYKVYIVDEVHMLSKSAHNALLKTLEEPPAHAIFILATTEVHAIPATILSRCLRFDFRLVAQSKLSQRIRYIFDDNNIEYERQAVELIASAGNGSVRDALSIADMCVSYGAGKVNYREVLEVLGASDPEKLAGLAVRIADGDISGALRAVGEMCELGKSMPVLASDLAALFRNVMYIKSCPDAETLLSIPVETYALYKTIAEKYTLGRYLEIMKIMSGLEGEFRYSTHQRILFEAAVITAAKGNQSVQEDKLRELQNRVAALEKRIAAVSAKGAPQEGTGAQPTQPAPKDGRQLVKALASKLDAENFQFLALSVLDADIETTESELKIKLPSKANFNLLTQPVNRRKIEEIFRTLSPLRLVFEEERKLDDDKALPFIKDMFGRHVEIK